MKLIATWFELMGEIWKSIDPYIDEVYKVNFVFIEVS